MKRTTPNDTPYKDYPGGKQGAGVYQSLINHIPPLRVYIAGFTGNDGIFKYMRRAEWTILNDLNKNVISDWFATGITLGGDVRLENMHILEFLKFIATDPELKRLLKHIFLYLDPPYLLSTRRGQANLYAFTMDTDQEHIEFLQAVFALPPEIKIMISHFPCDLYDRMLKDWQTFDFPNKTRQGVVIERIYMNYQLDGHLHDYSYIGQNFRVREKNKRIMTNFFAKLDRTEPQLRNAILQEYDLKHRIKQR